jgi:hypothetical protein
MRDEHNPYRSPVARVADAVLAASADEDTCWRSGHTLIVLRDRPLPPRCVKCNADAHDGMQVRTFVYVSHWSYSPLLVLLAVPLLGGLVSWRWLLAVVPLAFLVALMASLFLRRKTNHAVGLCAHHRRLRGLVQWISIGLFVAGLLVPVLTGMLMPMFVLIGFSIVVGYGTRLLTSKGIDARHAHYRDCGEDFLLSLPELPDDRQRSS